MDMRNVEAVERRFCKFGRGARAAALLSPKKLKAYYEKERSIQEQRVEKDVGGQGRVMEGRSRAPMISSWNIENKLHR